jgi:hypothetical protein
VGEAVRSGLPDFSWYNKPKREKMYQNGGKYTKSQNMPNGRKIDQMDIKYNNITRPSKV